MEQQAIGLIAGNGKFPILFAQKAKQKQLKVVAAGIAGDTSQLLRFFVDKFTVFKVGELSNLFRYFKEQGVQQVIMAGQVNPDNLFEKNIQFDKRFQQLFEAIKDRKADTIFASLADQLKQDGMELINSTFLLEDALSPKGTLTRRAPSLKELDDIAFGQTIAKAMGGLDVGQTVVIKDKAIVAIEAMEGTDKTILRGGKIAREGAVVVKMSKPKQDFRFDVPVIGPRTIKTMIKSGCRCLAIEAHKTIIIDRDITVRLANKSAITIVAVS